MQNTQAINVKAGSAVATGSVTVDDRMPGVPCPGPAGFTYVGARYVPLFAEPVEWTSGSSYEPLTIVTYEGDSYTSRQYVPVGIQITNEDYWVKTGNFNAQLEVVNENYKKIINGTFYVVDSTSLFDEVPENVRFVETRGFHSADDGGAARYIVSESGTADGITVIEADGRYFNLIINAQMAAECFGAIGDGVSDDWAALETALKVTNVIANKEYSVSKTVHAAHSLSGTGMIEMRSQFEGDAMNGLVVVVSPNVTVDGIKLAGNTPNKANQYPASLTGYTYGLVLTDGADYANVRNVEAFNFSNAGIIVWTNSASNIRVDNCDVHDCGCGFAMEKWTYEPRTWASNVYVSNSTFTSQGGGNIGGCEGLTFVNCRFASSYPSAGVQICIPDAQAPTVCTAINCQFEHTGSNANGARALGLYGYVRTASGGSTRYAEMPFNMSMINCTVTEESGTYAMVIADCDNVTMSNTTVNGQVLTSHNDNVTGTANRFSANSCVFKSQDVNQLANLTTPIAFTNCTFIGGSYGITYNNNVNAQIIGCSFNVSTYAVQYSQELRGLIISNTTVQTTMTNMGIANRNKLILLNNGTTDDLPSVFPVIDPTTSKTAYDGAKDGTLFAGTDHMLYTVYGGEVYKYDGTKQ